MTTMPDVPLIIVPPTIEAVIEDFNSRSEPYTCMDVYSAVCAARSKLDEVSPEINSGAWAEVLAFGLTGTEHNEKPWGTYFGPLGSGTNEDGETFYFPDASQADPNILLHWKERASNVTAPVLKARYNDLAWDLSKFIADENSDVKFARSAIDSYLTASGQDKRDSYDAFHDAERALALAIQINDVTRRDASREALLTLHKKELAENGMWWAAYDALEEQPKSGLTDAERRILITDLEGVLLRVSDISGKARFDPHDVESAANKLIAHYRSVGRNEELPRLHLAIAKAFEHFGGMASPMLASMVFQTSMEAYRQAGKHADERRVLGLIEKSNVDSAAQMTRHEVKQEIPTEELEKFLKAVVCDTKEETFQRIAGEFLIIRSTMQDSLAETAKSSPLSSMMPRTKLSGDRIVAQIGSIDEDPVGRLIEHSNLHINLSTAWLGWALDRAKEQHKISVDDIVEWANRTELFGDGSLLHDGVTAWFAEDHVKAAHILVPQIEAGFRKLVGFVGRPTTKPHPQMRQARMVVTLGEILFSEETASALGKHGVDIVLHFRSLYADPRGYNLRNDLAHGLVASNSLNSGIMLWVIHSLLLLGAWIERDEQLETVPSKPSGSGDTES